LIGEGIADQRISCSVFTARERAERGRDASGLDVDGATAPRSNAHVQRIRLHPVAVLTPNLGEDRDLICYADIGVHSDAKKAQRVVLVVGVVEPRAVGVVLRRQRDRHIGADHDSAAGERQRTRQDLLRVCGARRAKAKKQQGYPAGFHRYAHTIIMMVRLKPDTTYCTRVAYIITEPCIGTKDSACVDVCPVDCIHPRKDEPAFETAEMLYIHPDECIDCGACVPACPVEAIYSLDETPHKWANFIHLNAAYYQR
jgi:ferredoxin